MSDLHRPGDEDAPAEDAPASRSQRKREVTRLQKMGERLVTLSREQTDRISLPPELREAVVFARTLTSHGARRRQMQRIGALMREVDPGPIQAGLDQLDQRGYREVMRLKEAESWRGRLLTEGDAALAALAEAIPSVDRQRIRQLVRNAGKAAHPPMRARASKELFRYILSLLSGAPEADE
ncbi:ribosome biogenesis factor YjgA [Desulfococcus sp.]|jgi:ribosome-associated protein|uniref:ribosome biogenesis factor YjgA n=1 Tax=Desulfococcus sp. TaxID=2025834 RepID=UPI003593D0AB